MLLKCYCKKVIMNMGKNHQKKVMTNKVFLSMFVGVLLIISSILLVSASGNLEKVLETTLDADNSNYVITPVPYGDFSNYINAWDFDDITQLNSEQRAGLVNGFELSEGNYVAVIKDGSWSRWITDSTELDTSIWSNNRNGGLGKVWEASADIIYNKNVKLTLERAGERNLFSSQNAAENAGKEDKIEFEHDGGKIYVVLDDYPITDNRGEITIAIYKAIEDEDEDEDDNNNHKERKARRIGTFNEPVWQCSSWSSCDNSVQTRTCNDLNHLNIEYNKPSEVKGCEAESVTATDLSKTDLSENTLSKNPAKIFYQSNYALWFVIGIAILLILIIVILIMRR